MTGEVMWSPPADYRYGDRRVDRRAEVSSIRAGLPTLEHVVHFPYPGGADDQLPAAPAHARIGNE